jgi:peptide/nickel transport system substrate-binding protein
MGVKSPAIDAMIAALLQAHERDDFVAAVRALDRVLMSGFYVVPLYHLSGQWIARWTTVSHPAETSLFGYLPETWWLTPPAQGNTAPQGK